MRTLTMIILAMVTLAVKAETFTIDGLTYTTTTGYECSVSGCTADITENLVIPTAVTCNDIEYNVTAIGREAFYKNSIIKSIEIPGSVKSLETSALRSCSSLAEVKFHEGLNLIGDYCFQDCKLLTDIALPRSVKTICVSSFNGCTSLARISLPDALVQLGNACFKGCTSLEAIDIPASVKTIGENAFSGCASLAQASLHKGLTKIGLRAFEGCSSLTYIDIPEGVTKIEKYTFNTCYALETAVLPSTLKTMCERCFRHCTSLKNLVIPEGVTTLEQDVFLECHSLAPINLPSTIKDIGQECFLGCRALTSIVIPEGITSLNYRTFGYCVSLHSVTLPSRLKTIPSSCFIGCTSIESISLPEGVTSLYSSAFEGCTGLTSIALHPSIATIGDWCFKNCTSLRDVSIPEGAGASKYTYSSVFENCTALTSIKLPASMTEIGASYFKGCTSLREVVFSESMTVLRHHTFEGCTALEHIDLPSSLQEIGTSAFENCTSLSSIATPDKVTVINPSAFRYCAALESAVLGKGLATIGNYAFGGCTALKTITSRNLLPPNPTASTFDSDAYASVTLKIDASSQTAYAEHEIWSKFANVEKVDLGYTSTFDSNDWALIQQLHSQLTAGGWSGKWHLEIGPNIVSQLSGLTIKDDHVAGISMAKCNVNAQAFATMLKFPMLQTLNVSCNIIEGDISEIIDESVVNPNLTQLDISQNRMSGNLAWVNDRFPALQTLTANDNRFSRIDPYLNAKSVNFNAQAIPDTVRLTLGPFDMQTASDIIPSLVRYDHYKKSFNFPEFTIRRKDGNILIRASLSGDSYHLSPYNYKTGTVFGINVGYDLYIEFGNKTRLPMILDFEKGDCNADAICDITDLQCMVNYILTGGPEGKIFNEKAVNFDGNETLDVLDIIGLVNYLLSLDEPQARAMAPALNAESEPHARLRLEDGAVMLDTDRPIAAIDFKLLAAEGFTLSPALKEAGFTCATKRKGNAERVIIYSASGARMPRGLTALGHTKGGSVSGCRASSPEGESVSVSLGLDTSGSAEVEVYISLTLGDRSAKVPARYAGGQWSAYDAAGRLIGSGRIDDGATSLHSPSTCIIVLTSDGEETHTMKINL